MKKFIFLAFCLIAGEVHSADVKLSQLPLGSAASTSATDSLPYVDFVNGVTKRLTLFDLINLPPIVSTYAPKASPTFTGTVTAPSFVGSLTGSVTGSSSGNLSYVPNQYGLLTSGAANVVTVIAPSASTAFPLISGGSGASPSWAALGIAGGGTGQTSKSAAFNALSPNTTLGDLTYGDGSNSSSRLPGNTTSTKSFLTQTGNGSISGAPAWSTISVNDVATMVGDSGSGGTKGLVPAPGTGDGAANKVLRADGTWGTAGTASPLTTKGDVYTFSSVNARLGVGTDGQILMADSTAATGLKFSNPVGGSLTLDTFSGNGSTTAFTLSTTPVNINTTNVYIGGVYQQKAGYSVSGNILTFSTAPPSGSSNVEVLSGSAALPLGGAVNPTVQKFTSGSGTYTTPANVLFIRVRMVGGGGGGAGGASGGGNGGTGGTSYFRVGASPDLLVANGGVGGATNTANGGLGGTASLGTGPIGTALSGGYGFSGSSSGSTATTSAGGGGGASAFGGAGSNGGSTNVGAGTAGVANTGGGGGGGAATATNSYPGSGGGAGGFVDAIITSPNATYSYSVGASGTFGAAGSPGYAGGAGGSGYIEVTEYYSNGAVGTATNVTGTVAIANGGTGLTSYSTIGPKTVFTASGTFTTPSNSSSTTIYEYLLIGGGGGGGGANGSGAAAGGGGAGAMAIGTFTGVAASTGISITINSGGGGGASSGGTGSTGGSAVIGSPVSITAGGGAGGVGSTAGSTGSSAGGAGGTITGSPTVSITGARGLWGYTPVAGGLFAGTGASTTLGGGGVGGGTGNGGGGAATGYGAGGGGSIFTTATGGAGSNGIAIITRLTP